MAGQGTVGLEILEQCPALDAARCPGQRRRAHRRRRPRRSRRSRRTCASTVQSRRRCRAIRESLRAGHPVQVEQQRSVADALVAQRPGDVCFPYVAENTDGFAPVADADHSARHEAAASGGQAPVRAVVRHRHRCAALRGQLPLRAGQTRSALSSAAAASRSSSYTGSRTSGSDRQQISAPAHLPSEGRVEADAVSGRYLLLASA